ncbi:serine/threonine-protein kinase [Saccharothrix lopnurensis]|uniref:non-specific serine/threonine protein kinase n=1 Tax=Saccharothrix lopnurensis TaxID=1670621 RepID=A0ABW1PB15_9PSEU
MSQSVSENEVAGRYRLIEPIGTGGMAEVHRGWDTVLRRHVAIKLFQPGFDPAAAQRFDQEVRALAGLSHPGLVSVYDADTEAGTPFVVLQLVEGDTLRQRISRGPLPVDRVRRLGAGLADALAHVHSRGLVHRDVKPSNILLDQEENPYLADFGLVHLTGATRLTRTDQMVGTAAYLAPEQVLGQDIDPQADVYALGLVLLECLTGRREYGGGDVEAAIARLHRAPVLPEHLPSDVEHLLSRMTAAEPHERPAAHDCAEVLAAEAAGLVPLPRSCTTPAGGISLPRGAAPAAVTGPAATAPDIATPDIATPAAAPEIAAPAATLAATAPVIAPDATAPAVAPSATAPAVAPAIAPDATVMTAAPPRERRLPNKTLLTSAGALFGAFAITTALTWGDEPATSAPVPTTSPSAPVQSAATAPPGSPGTPAQVTAGPRQVVNPPQATDAPQVTTTAPPVTTSAATPVPTSQPAAGPDTGTTTEPTEPVVPTTVPQQTSDPVEPTTDDPGTTAEPEEPTAPSSSG